MAEQDFLTRGVFQSGFARFRYEGCAREHLVPFSCKGRGFRPNCDGRGRRSSAAPLVWTFQEQPTSGMKTERLPPSCQNVYISSFGSSTPSCRWTALTPSLASIPSSFFSSSGWRCNEPSRSLRCTAISSFFFSSSGV